MNLTPDISFYCALVLSLSVQVTGKYSIDIAPLFTGNGYLLHEIYKTIVLTASPWKALHSAGHTLPFTGSIWPKVFDMASGPPKLTAHECSVIHTLPAVLCVSVWCPQCKTFTPSILDSNLAPMQTLADDILCVGCDSPLWPWPSNRNVSTQETTTPDPGCSPLNIFPFQQPRKVHNTHE